jgi:lathosterol oxidase
MTEPSSSSSEDVSPAPEFRFGEGKISGVLAVALGLLALGAVLAMRFPGWLTTPEARSHYPLGLIRGLIAAVIVAAYILGTISVFLSSRKGLGLAGIGLAAMATALGGSRVPIRGGYAETPYLALDWFVLSLFILALVFVPLERAFARLKDQRVFRKGWKTDLVHFGVSHLLVQVTVLLTMLPATLFFHWAVSDRFQAWVRDQHLALQFVGAMIVADLFAYIAHRLFHAVPFLWRFHEVHHSSEEMDWLAGSRLHLVDIVVTRAFAFIPLYVIGFSPAAIGAYLTWTSFQAVFIHSNVRFRFGPLRLLLATPQFHHWHHSATLYDKNFAVNLPIIDKIFGTYHLPQDEWPEEYGLKGNPVPEGYLSQLVYPLKPKARSGDASPAKSGQI